jgi:hypothetical protein
MKCLLNVVQNTDNSINIMDTNGNYIVENWIIGSHIKIEEYESIDKSEYVKEVIKLKEAGFDAKDIISLIGDCK